MYLLHIKKRLSDLLALSALLLFMALEMVSCKDMKDCRSLYNTNVVWIEFKGTKSLTRNHADVELPTGGRKNIETFFSGNEWETAIRNNLKDLKGKRLPLLLDDKHRIIKLFLYKTATASQPDIITLHYQAKHSLLSPSCGIQIVYVLERIETSFQSSTILATEGKITNPGTAGNDKPHVEISY